MAELTTLQSKLTSDWFAQLRQGILDDSTTRQIAELVEERGGFARIAHWLEVRPKSVNSKQLLGKWMVDAVGHAKLALATILQTSDSNLALQYRSGDDPQAEDSPGWSELIRQGDIERQIQVDVIKTDADTCQIKVGVFPSDDATQLKDVEVKLHLEAGTRIAQTDKRGRVIFDDIPSGALDQATLEIAPPSTRVAHQ